MSANDIQVGGNHYARGGSVQHWDLISKNFGPSYLVGCATKYLARWRQKAGVQDLRKALHYVQKLQEGVAEGLFAPLGKRMLVVTVEDFIAANAIDSQEGEAIHALIYWGEAGDLRRAQEITEALIAQESELLNRLQGRKAGVDWTEERKAGLNLIEGRDEMTNRPGVGV
ncbi:hypothetical protein CPT_Sonora_046 [Stenotrophomonas phage Sonora]|nr:hypothetical protein CPT_Sonora_046 [Stenotrophomonas phage Sonora]